MTFILSVNRLQSTAYLNGEPVSASNGVEDLEVRSHCVLRI